MYFNVVMPIDGGLDIYNVYPALHLLGRGDSEFAKFAKAPIPGSRLIYVGVGVTF